MQRIAKLSETPCVGEVLCPREGCTLHHLIGYSNATALHPGPWKPAGAQTLCLDYILSNATAPKAMEGRSAGEIANHWHNTMRLKTECAP